MSATKYYPLQYRCTHCGNAGYTKKDGIATAGRTWLTCPTCQFGALEKMRWNGFIWC